MFGNKKRKREEEIKKEVDTYKSYVCNTMEACYLVLSHMRSDPYICQVTNWHSLSLDFTSISTLCELLISHRFIKNWIALPLDQQLNNLKLFKNMLSNKVKENQTCPLFTSPINMTGACKDCVLFRDKVVITNMMWEIINILQPEYVKVTCGTDLVQEYNDYCKNKGKMPKTNREYTIKFVDPIIKNNK